MKVTLSQKTQDQRELREDVLRLIEEERQFKEYEKDFKERKKYVNLKLMNYFEKLGCDGANLAYDEGNIKLTMVKPTTFEWNIQKLKQAIGKRVSNKVINKRIIINDYDSLVLLLKNHGVKANDFKQCIFVEEEVDNKEIENCLELGEITKKQIKGTYKLNGSNPYVRITNRKENG